MRDGFDHLRCPMCGGELIYSEGTHDLCCARNPYESMSGEEWEAAAALHDERAEYGEWAGERDAGRLYIYKVWEEGEEGGRLKQSAGGSANMKYPLTLHPLPPDGGEGIITTDEAVSTAQVSAGEGDGANPPAAHLKGHASSEAFGHHGGFETITSSGDDAQTSDAPVKTDRGQDKEDAVHSHTREVSAGEKDYAQTSDTHVRGHAAREDAALRGELEGFAGAADRAQASDAPVKGHASSEAARPRGEFEAYSGGMDTAPSPNTPVKTHKGQDREDAVHSHTREVSAEEYDRTLTSDTPVRGHKCVFAVSFTESGRFGTLWSLRTVHAETNYFSLTRLMQKIEKRLRNGQPLAANAPHQPKKREKSAAAKLAFRFGIEEEDVYSIRFSTETVKRLALFYGIPERDVRRIRAAEIEGEE